MSQEYASTPRKYRRPSRGQRNRPMLVTASDVEQEMEPATVETTTAVEEPVQEAAPTPVVENSTRPRRLPRFFSTVGKNEQNNDGETKEKESIAQARIARATRGKTPAATSKGTNDKAVAKKETAQPDKAGTGNAKPAPRPASPFKTRYIFGMLIYIVGSTFLSSVELNFMQSNHLDNLLTTLNIFGLKLAISSFTLVYLATLVLLLIILAYFDFIPRGFTSRSQVAARKGNTQTRTTTAKSSTESTVEGPRTIPPPIRQGVKGEDDDLYQEYRMNQRREKKR